MCLNSEKTIERTIKSVLNQTYSNIEYIIVDGKSSDNTTHIIEKYSRSISKYISESDTGIYNAMNKGLKLATGKYVAFLNSDDWYFEDTVERVVEQQQQADIDGICGGMVSVSEKGFENSNCPLIIDFDDLYYRMPFCHQTLFVKRDKFEEYGLFNENYRIAADYEWLLGAYIRGFKLVYLQRTLCYFQEGGISSKQMLECVREQRDIALNYLPDHLREKYLPRIEKQYSNAHRYIEIKPVMDILFSNDHSILIKVLAKYVLPGEKVYIFGGGAMGIECIKWLRHMNVDIVAIIDNNASKWGAMLEDIPVISPYEKRIDKYKIFIASNLYYDEMYAQLINDSQNHADNIFAFHEIRNTILNDKTLTLGVMEK